MLANVSISWVFYLEVFFLGEEPSVGLHQLPHREPHLRLSDQGDDDAGRQKFWLQVCPLREVPAAAHEGNFLTEIFPVNYHRWFLF